MLLQNKHQCRRVETAKIQNTIANENTIISTQVFKEAANVLFKKFEFELLSLSKPSSMRSPVSIIR